MTTAEADEFDELPEVGTGVVVALEQRQVPFYGDEVTAVRAVDGLVYVPIRPLCEIIGVDWSAQYRRITRDLVLNRVAMSVAITAMEIDPHRKTPHTSEMLCLPLDYLNGWLFGINASRVKEGIREKLIQYQLECYRILADAFLQPPATALTATEVSLRQIEQMGYAIAQMAREQIQHERRLNEHDQRLDAAARYVLDLNKRLQAVEKRVSPGQPISDEQAAELAGQVKGLAQVMQKRSPEVNPYQSIWGEIYRRFRVSSYKLIPQSEYTAVVQFLTEWAERVLGETDETV
jgi:hypothetical protein